MKNLTVNEVFLSVQGEGVRQGTANVFVRFTGCNLKCDLEAGPKSPGGFACDTEFASGRSLSVDDLHQWIEHEAPAWSQGGRWLILTGGEPALQVTAELCANLRTRGYLLAIETNGTIALPEGALDWITLSPKVAEHAVKQMTASELRYVRGYGQGIPKPAAKAEHHCISPAFKGEDLDWEALRWCQKLVLENPTWRLSVQSHKLYRVR